MTDKEMTNLFLFGGHCTYYGQSVNVVGKNELTGTYTLQVQNNTHIIPDVRADECTKPREGLHDGY